VGEVVKIFKEFLVVFTCILLVFLSSVPNQSLAACTPAVKIVGDSYSPTSIQDAYDYASGTLGLAAFTLRLSAEIFTENLRLDGGAALLDGGYDCAFSTKASTSKVFGSITVSRGAVRFAEIGVVSTAKCDFDRDMDGYTAVGSCAGSADDCADTNANIHAGAVEICDGLDNNCDGQVDEGLTPIDADGDGYYALGSCGTAGDDCNDNHAGIHPGALDIPYDGIDQDCNGADLTFVAESNCASGACHGPGNTWTALHDLTRAPDVGPLETPCSVCHAAQVSNVLPGHYGDRVRTAGNNMPAGALIICVSCHDQSSDRHTGEVVNGNGSNYVTNKIWGPAYPLISCDSCHENRASVHATGSAHDNRIIDPTCGTCHTSDTRVLGNAGAGTLASAADVDSLHRSDCALCHVYSGTSLDAGNVRQVIQQGLNGSQIACTGCHTNKVSNHGAFEHPVAVGPGDLSYSAPGQLCSACHVVANWAEIEGIEHNVATNGAGSCATCHNSPRQAVIDAIALRANPTHCLDCHADKYLTPHGSVDHLAFGYVVGGTAYCLNCHDPGTAENATVSVTHISICAHCHTSVPNLQPGLPAGGGDCSSCHMSTWTDLHTPNPPDHSSLVQVATTTCANCHDNILVSAAARTHNACNSCHDAQGSLVSLAMGQDFITGGDCTSCHTSTWEATHTPNVPSHGSLVQVATSSCASCHDDTLVSAATNTHNGCSSCHAADGSPRSLAIGKFLFVGGDCTSCHAVTWDRDHAISCLSCHDQIQDNLDGIPAAGRRAVGTEFPSGTTHAHLASQTEITNADCLVCHHLANHTDSWVKLLDADSGNLYAFQQAADLSADPDLSTFCLSCHDQDGAVRLAEPSDPFGNGNPPPDTASRFLGTLEWQELHGDMCFGSEGSLRYVNSHHDLSNADQANSGAKLECLNCHSAHSAADTQILADPFNPLTPWTGGLNGFCLTCHNGGDAVDSVILPEGVAMGMVTDANGFQVNALGGMDSCSYNREPWWVDVRVTSTAHLGGSKRGWAAYSSAPEYAMECTVCHDPHGSYSPSNPAGNPYAIRDNVDGSAYVDDGARTAGFNGPPWTTFGVNQQVVLTPTAENLDLRNLCATCHSAWEAAYSWHAYDCTGCLNCHSHGAAWDSNDWGSGGNTPWCP
jgi:predicted CXXCH cytochrome family protein